MRDFNFCLKPATEVWKRIRIWPHPIAPEHQGLLAFAPLIYYCADHGFDGPERRHAMELVPMNIEYCRKRTLENFEVCVITRA